MILVLDNYDSFTYNLVQRIGELDSGWELQVVRNDVMTAEQAHEQYKPTHLIISPGPCTPNEAGSYDERPTSFESTDENGVSVFVLEPHP